MPSIRLLVFYGLLILSVSVAVFKGGKPEKAGALIILGMVALQFASLAFETSAYRTVDVGSVLVDAFGVIGFGVLALHAMRVWPIWATSLQILSLSSHFARDVDVKVHPLVYVAMKTGPTFLVLVALLIATIFHRRRLKRFGADPPWKVW